MLKKRRFFLFSSWEPIVNFVDQQYDNFFQDESGLNRKNMSDTRVHCVLHFINPQGHGYVDDFNHSQSEGTH